MVIRAYFFALRAIALGAIALVAGSCLPGADRTTGPAPTPGYSAVVVVTLPAGTSVVGGGGGTPPVGATDEPPPTVTAAATVAAGTLHNVLPATLAGRALTRTDIAGGDADVASGLGVAPDRVEVANVSDDDGRPIGWAFRVAGTNPQAIYDVVAPRFTPPGAQAVQTEVADRPVLKIAAPVGSTYMLFSGEALVILGGPTLTESNVEDLIAQVP